MTIASMTTRTMPVRPNRLRRFRQRMADSEKQAYVEMAKKDQERYESEKAEYYKDYPQPSPKRKNTRWSEDEMGLLKSVSLCRAYLS